MSHRVVYMGTPGFAGPALEALSRVPGVTIPLVVTQPDRPAGRGRTLQAPPIRLLADSLGLPVYQVASLKSPEQRLPIVDAQPDLIVVAAFGLILGRSILTLPPCGCLNLHASLLPKYRGASPISAAIHQGDQETGVTLMRMERGLDTGPMIGTIRESIRPDDTTASLTARLANAAANVLLQHLPAILRGEAPETPQPAGATLTRPLVKADGWIDWSRPAVEIDRHVRAMWPWPRAWTTWPDGMQFQIHEAQVETESAQLAPGQVRLDPAGLLVGCGNDRVLRVLRGQVSGGKAHDGRQLASGPAFRADPMLGTGDAPTVPGPMIVPVDDMQ